MRAVAEDALDDLGRLLQGLLVLLAYLDFMQFLIIWQSDLPQEAAWYVARSTGLWGLMAGDRGARAFPAAVLRADVAAAAPVARRPWRHRGPADRDGGAARLVAGAARRRALHRLDRHRGDAGVRRACGRLRMTGPGAFICAPAASWLSTTGIPPARHEARDVNVRLLALGAWPERSPCC